MAFCPGRWRCSCWWRAQSPAPGTDGRGAGARLPEPAAPTATQVAHHKKEREDGKRDQKPVLDMADVIAAHHRQQEYDAEQPDGVPGAVIDPAPPPRCGRDLGDVDAVVVLHLGTGHGESLSDGSASPEEILAHPPRDPVGIASGAQ